MYSSSPHFSKKSNLILYRAILYICLYSSRAQAQAAGPLHVYFFINSKTLFIDIFSTLCLSFENTFSVKNLKNKAA